MIGRNRQCSFSIKSDCLSLTLPSKASSLDIRLVIGRCFTVLIWTRSIQIPYPTSRGTSSTSLSKMVQVTLSGSPAFVAGRSPRSPSVMQERLQGSRAVQPRPQLPTTTPHDAILQRFNLHLAGPKSGNSSQDNKAAIQLLVLPIFPLCLSRVRMPSNYWQRGLVAPCIAHSGLAVRIGAP